MSVSRSGFKWLLVVAVATGCTRVVDLTVDQGPVRLVIEGRIELRDNDPVARQRIRLTTTDAYQSSAPPPPARGAVVRVSDDRGHLFPFAESATEPGVYLRDGLVAVLGARYMLTIDYQGERYEGSHQLNAVPPIDSLYFVYREKGLAQGDSGFRALIDYADPAGVRNYYLWELLVDGKPRIKTDPGNRFRIISDDRFYDGGRVIGYQPYDEEVVEPGQQVTIRQVALSEAGFRYYTALFEQTTGGGGPFSTPPASVRGNMSNRTNQGHYPLGFFFSAQVSERTERVPPSAERRVPSS